MSKDLLKRCLTPPPPTASTAADAYEGVNNVLTSAPRLQLNGVYYGLVYGAYLTVHSDGCQSYLLRRKGSFPPLLVAYVLKRVHMVYKCVFVHMYVCNKYVCYMCVCNKYVCCGIHLIANGNQTDKPSEPSGKKNENTFENDATKSRSDLIQTHAFTQTNIYTYIYVLRYIHVYTRMYICVSHSGNSNLLC